ncbi:MAG: hypothetical protein QG656_1847, partial [Candidatus Hydrogenedentes bacterium]|nr:hypothetical protein [Candidatus Hydrogenedentota bacterium]
MTHLTQALLAVCVFAGVAGADVLRDREQHAWQPVRDDVYLQEVGRKVVTESPVLAVAVCGGKLYAGFENGVRVLDGDALPPMETPVGAVRRLKALNGALYLVTDKGLFRLDGAAWKELGAGDFTDLCLHQGSVVVSVQRELFRLDGDILVPIENAANCPQPILRVASYSETIYCLLPGQLCVFDGKAYDSVNVSDWGKLPSETTRDLMALGSRLMTATDRGVAVLRGMAITALTGADGLCYEDTTCLTPGFAGDFWIGTTRGAIRAVDGEYHYFAADRWLPGDRVYDVACGDRVAYIATDKGLGIVEYEPYTMEKKAAYYERHLEEWGQKRLGFTHKLEWNPAKGGWIREVSDNDVGWSTHYLAAQCFKYAATGDETALKEAINSFHSMKWSEEISSIPGFPARAIWAVGETGHQAEGGSGGYAAEWHRTPDDVWEWKGDTSSDETDAQWYAASIYYDLTADDIEKKRVAQHLERVGGHIADNGWVLRDVDGKPTRWARWDPEYFKSFTGYYARGLNGLEALSYMRATASITGNPKFEEAYKTLLGFGYQDEVLRQKLTFPPDAVFHSDDRLAFYTYYTLLKYETDPYLRGLYLRSLERSYEI